MTLLHAAALALCLLGFTALALASARPQDDLFGQALAADRTRALRLAGWATLVLALIALVRVQGWAMGLVSFSGHTSLAAGLVWGGLIVQARWWGGRR